MSALPAIALLLSAPCAFAQTGRAPVPLAPVIATPIGSTPAGPVASPLSLSGPSPAAGLLPAPILSVGTASFAPAALPSAPPSRMPPATGGLAGAMRRVLARLVDPFGARMAEGVKPTVPEPADFGIGEKLRLGPTEAIVLRVRIDELDAATRSGNSWKLRTLSRRWLRGAQRAGEAPQAETIEAAEALSVRLPASRRQLARVRAFREFRRRDLWSEIGPALKDEVLRLRAMKADERRLYLRAAGDAIVEAIRARHGGENIGFHYNLHGGRPESYVEDGGIRISRGDVQLEHAMSGDPNYKVYFFQSKEHSLYDALNQTHPNLIFRRMGDVLNIFRRDAPELVALEAAGAALRPTAISLDFDEAKLAQAERGNIGIPYEAYVAPPLIVFPGGVGKRIGAGRLDRDEETLAAMRYIEAAAALGNDI